MRNRQNPFGPHLSARPRRITALIIMLMLVVAVALVGCTGKEEKKVVVASKPMPEQYIIAEMLALLIESETDIQVEKLLGVGGGTSNIHPAMLEGDIDLYPEYTGTGWLFVLKKDLIRDPEALYEETKKAYLEQYGIHWTGLYGFENAYGLAVTREIAEQYGLRTISDLAAVSPQLTFSANGDFLEREDGYAGLQSTYGLDFGTLNEIDIGLRYEVLRSGETDAMTVFTTDGQLSEAEVKILEDDLNFFPAYDAATLVRAETLEKYPELEPVLEKLTGQISNEEMVQMNYAVEKENKDPAEVAKAFLEEKGLLAQ